MPIDNFVARVVSEAKTLEYVKGKGRDTRTAEKCLERANAHPPGDPAMTTIATNDSLPAPLSSRIRPASECAPWVFQGVLKLEAEIRQHAAARREFTRAMEHAVSQGLEAATFLRCWIEGDWEACAEFGFTPNMPGKEAQSTAPQQEPCWCETCRPVTLSDMRMVLCPSCDNKRCPHATDHRNACTASNEPGQPGSSHPAPASNPNKLVERKVKDAIRAAYDLGYNDARNSEAKPGDEAPGHKGRQVEADHGGALIARLGQLSSNSPSAGSAKAHAPTLQQIMALARCLHETTPDADDWDSLRQFEVDGLRARAEKILLSLSQIPRGSDRG